MSSKAIPVLQCSDLEPTLEFYRAMGCEVEPRARLRPTPYTVITRGDVELHLVVWPNHDPEVSYTSCYIRVDDVDAVYAEILAQFVGYIGYIPTVGRPRLTTLKTQSYGVRRFRLIDPAGNRIRFGQVVSVEPLDPTSPEGQLELALDQAVFQGESLRDYAGAVVVLRTALADYPSAPPTLRLRTAVTLADMLAQCREFEAAAKALHVAREIELSAHEMDDCSDWLLRADHLGMTLARVAAEDFL